MYETIYHRPSSVDEAAALFAKGSDAKYLAGGHTLLPVMKQRLASPSDVAESGPAQTAIPALAHLASLIGDPAVRHRGTIGGSIANNDPAADYPAAVLALGAIVKTNKRSISADDFFKGLFTTALADGEASRCFITGSRVWPPARYFASEPLANSAAASSTEEGR